jgi:hypothetical protein
LILRYLGLLPGQECLSVGGPFDGLAMTVLPGERTVVRRSGDILHEYRSDRDRPGRMDHSRVWMDKQEG